MVDRFAKPATGEYTLTTPWPAADAVLDDGAAPELAEACITSSGHLEVELSEIPDSSTLTAITVDGQSLAWNPQADGRRLRSATPIAAGSHTFGLAMTLQDLATRRESQIRARHRQTMVFLATVNPNHDPREALWRYYREGGYNAVDAAGAVGGFLGPPGLGSSSALGQFHESLAYQLANKGQIAEATLELVMAVGGAAEG